MSIYRLVSVRGFASISSTISAMRLIAAEQAELVMAARCRVTLMTGGSDGDGLDVAPKGFYVDLVHSHNVTPMAPPPEPPRNWSAEPDRPSGLVTRWRVLPGRDAGRDNRLVDLKPGQTARIVVHLPESVRDRFKFNLKHDKRNAPDRGRTARIGHGSVVRGDAHNWPGFGTRIYLGERNGSDKHGFNVAPNGFYVDLVLR